MSIPDPTELQEFAKLLCGTLPAAVKRTMANQYEQLMAGHRAQTGATQCFLVGRHGYFADQNVLPLARIRGTPNALPENLMPAFHEWEAPFKALERDLTRIKQTIGSIVMRAQSWQDVRNMFPDHFSRPVLFFSQFDLMQRTTVDLQAGPEADAVWGENLTKMYTRVGNLVDLYLGYKLL